MSSVSTRLLSINYGLEADILPPKEWSKSSLEDVNLDLVLNQLNLGINYYRCFILAEWAVLNINYGVEAVILPPKEWSKSFLEDVNLDLVLSQFNLGINFILS